ncbi:hypothetical protein Trydic_g23382, partial [Trypoxylus dichotomus]
YSALPGKVVFGNGAQVTEGFRLVEQGSNVVYNACNYLKRVVKSTLDRV